MRARTSVFQEVKKCTHGDEPKKTCPHTHKEKMHVKKKKKKKKTDCTVSAEHAHVLLSVTPCDLQGCMGSGVRGQG